MKRTTKTNVAKYIIIENNTKKIVQILVSIGANVIIITYSTEKTIKIKTAIYKTTINNAL